MNSLRPRAFTLVELLVVIGIIGALIAILLPVLSGVQARGRDVACQSNVRQILQAIQGYVAENKGSMPYGSYWDPSLNDYPDPYHPSNTWQPKNGTTRFVSWASLVGKYMVGRIGTTDNASVNFPKVLQCPEALQARPHVVGYAMNWVVAVTPRYEIEGGTPPNAQLKPPTVTLMLKETVLLWDKAIRPNWENNVGHLTGADIDGQRMAWDGVEFPQQRYYSIKDPFKVFPGKLGQEEPVKIDWSGRTFYNKDPDTSDVERWPYQGNLRFRHNKNTTCNAGFSDGSVRQFTAKINPNNTVKSHDAKRRYFMIKWPAGVRPNPARPF